MRYLLIFLVFFITLTFVLTSRASANHEGCLTAGFWVEDSIYNLFDPTKNPESKNTFEQWAERQMNEWNKILSSSGVKDCFKIGKIVRVADGALPLTKSDNDPYRAPTNFPDVSDRTIDVQWGFPTGSPSSKPPNYTTNKNYINTVLNGIDWALLHELSHARYLIDQYALNIHTSRDRIELTNPQGKPIIGTYLKPIYGDMVYKNKAGDLMSDLNNRFYAPHSATALNLIAGQHTAKEFGNFNPPANIAIYLNDLPSNNILRILNIKSQPIPGAKIRIFQSIEGSELYSKIFDNIPDIEGVTDNEGGVVIGHNPFGGDRFHWHLGNSLFILEVSSNNQLFYKIIEVTDFNLAYWRGAKNEAIFDIQTNIGAEPTSTLAFNAKIEAPSSVNIGEQIKFTARVSQKDSIPKSAEIWVTKTSGDIDCNGAEKIENWCKIAKAAFIPNLFQRKYEILSGEWVPKEPGVYMAVVNIYGKEGVNCSGNPNRPPEWVDCGDESRLIFKVSSITPTIKPVEVSYFADNKSNKQIGIIPEICELSEGKDVCVDSSGPMLIPPKTNGFFDYNFYIGPVGPIQPNKQYRASCEIQIKAESTTQCPGKIVRGGEKTEIRIQFSDKGIEELSPTPMPTPKGTPPPQAISSESASPASKENTKSVVGILVNGQRLGFGGTSVSIRLPDIVARGATHAVPITISYSGKDGFVSRNLIFRYVVPGGENSGESFNKGQECNPAKYSCFVMAEQESGSPERLFCRNMGDGYKWVTQKHAYELCQGKEGITSLCKDKEGNETTYYCTGQDWANEAGWKEYQEKLKKAQEASKPHEVLPQGPLLERLRQLEEESKGLSCSLEAYPQRIKVGQEITWIIKTHNFTGAFAEWRGTDNGQELVIPVPVHEFPKPNSPNLWMENYPYPRGGTYTRYAVIKDAEGRTCQTNTLEAVIEDSSIAQGLPGGEALTSITRYVNLIQPKTVSKIVLLLPPYGQQREVRPGERTQLSLPDTGGVPQTVQLPITIIYSDGSTGNKTISFAYKGNTCGLSGGKCANDKGQTRNGYQCSIYRSDLTGCSIEKDNVYPYCYTGCSQTPTGATTSTPTVPTPVPTPESTVTPTPTTSDTTCRKCGDSDGNTAEGIKCSGWLANDNSCSGNARYPYCFTCPESQ